MSIETVNIVPEMDAEQFQRMYRCMNEEGQHALDEILNSQDLEMHEGFVSQIPLRYNTLAEGRAEARITFADDHVENWRVDFRDNELWLTDLNGEVYESLQDLRPSEDCPKHLHIIDIEIMFPHHIIGF